MKEPPISLEAPAKINLTLEVLGRRADGYHTLASVFQTVDLADRLTFAPRPDGAIVVETGDPALATAPQNNLVWRAARLLQQVGQIPLGAQITLDKRIPLAAGLGGGSSDAAATLRGLARLWNLGLPAAALQQLASRLGSDVPFFIQGGTALVGGRGEQVTRLRPLAGGWFVLVTPPFILAEKTRVVYSLLRPAEYTDGGRTRRLAETLARGDLPPAAMFYNGLEDAAFRAFAGLAAIRQRVVATGGESVRVAGAGPSLFVYYPQAGPAQALAAALQAAGQPVHLVRPVAPPAP